MAKGGKQAKSKAARKKVGAKGGKGRGQGKDEGGKKRGAAGAYGGQSKATTSGLRECGLRVKKVTADGNCLFRSLCDQIYGESGDFHKMRQEIMDCVVENEEGFAPFVLDEDEDESFKDYCCRMRKDGEWGGQVELQAAAIVYSVDIAIHQENLDLPPLLLKTPKEKKARTIHLEFIGAHYNSVRKNTDFEDGPAEEIDFDVFSSKSAGGKGEGGNGDEEEEEEEEEKDSITAREGKLRSSSRTAGAEEEGEVGGGGGRKSIKRSTGGQSAKRVSRHKLCPCGSGLKYKACCKKGQAQISQPKEKSTSPDGMKRFVVV